ncbi:MAG: hypothetical protein ACYCYF_08415 [Anaerolineae bacterium]
MNCGFCGRDFDPAAANAACGACPVGGSCHLVRCPYCGYESPPEAKLIGWLRQIKSRVAAARSERQGRIT